MAKDIDIGDRVLIEADVTRVDENGITVRIHSYPSPVSISFDPIRKVEKLKRPLIRDWPDLKNE